MCPVGALTSRTYRFAARPWEFQSQDSICSMCGVGCNVAVQTRNGELMRVNARLNEDVNEEWTCDRGKFEQYWVNSLDRAKNPMIRRAGSLAITDWDDVLAGAAKALKDAAAIGPNAVAGIGSTQASNEDLYLFQRLMRGVLGTNNLDHRMFPFPIQPMQTSIAEVGEAKHIVAVGTQIDDDLPVLWLRVYKAISKGGAKYFREDDVRRAVRRRRHRRRAGDGRAGVVRAAAGDIQFLTDACAKSGAKLNVLLPDANSWGAIKMGVLPDRLPALQSVEQRRAPEVRDSLGRPHSRRAGPGHARHFGRLRSGPIKALYVMGSDLVKNYPDAELVRRALEKVPFLIVQDMFITETAKYADVFLPSCSFVEKDGSFTNIEGRVQSFKRAVQPRGKSKADWQIVAELMTRLGKPAPYFSPRDIAREIVKATA